MHRHHEITVSIVRRIEHLLANPLTAGLGRAFARTAVIVLRTGDTLMAATLDQTIVAATTIIDNLAAQNATQATAIAGYQAQLAAAGTTDTLTTQTQADLAKLQADPAFAAAFATINAAATSLSVPPVSLPPAATTTATDAPSPTDTTANSSTPVAVDPTVPTPAAS